MKNKTQTSQEQFINFCERFCRALCNRIRSRFYGAYALWLKNATKLLPPPPSGLKDSSVSWTRISGDDLSLEFEYKDETWNEIAYLNERIMVRAQNGRLFPMPDNACENTRVEFHGDSFRVESHERIPNRWVMLCGKYAQGSVYAVEYDFRTDSDFTEIQFAFNYRNIAERVRLMVVDNRELIFQTVEKGAFIRPTKTRPWRFEHGRTYHVRIEVRGDVFSYIVDGEPLMTLRVPEFLAAREDDSFALIFWEKDDVRPISAEIRNFRVFRGNEIASKTYTNR